MGGEAAADCAGEVAAGALDAGAAVWVNRVSVSASHDGEARARTPTMAGSLGAASGAGPSIWRSLTSDARKTMKLGVLKIVSSVATSA